MYVTEIEGDLYTSWEDWQKRPVTSPQGKRAHAITFDDGTVFDMSNGWRENTPQGWRRIEDSRIDGTGWAEAAFCDDVDPSQREPVPTCEDALRRAGYVLNGDIWTKRHPQAHA